MSEALKPCPFCGQKALVFRRPKWRNNPIMFLVQCDRVGPTDETSIPCASGRPFNTKEEAVTAWNTRPSDKLRQDVVEAAIRVRESGAGELPDYANQKSMDRWARGIKTLVELCDAVDRLRHAEDGEK